MEATSFIPFFLMFEFVSTVFWFLFGKVGMSEWNVFVDCSSEVSKEKTKETLILLVLSTQTHPIKNSQAKNNWTKNKEGFHLSNSIFSVALNSWGCLDILAAHLVIRSAWPMDWVGLAGHTLPIQYAERRPRATRAMAGLVEPPKRSKPPSCSFWRVKLKS